VRYRSLVYAKNPDWEGEKEKEYRKSLWRYLRDNQVHLIDYTLNPEINVSHYGGGDHLNDYGRKIWTRQMGSDLSAIMNGNITINNGFWPDVHSSAVIYSPVQSQNLFAGTNIVLNCSGDGGVLWSCMYGMETSGELYIGNADSLSYSIPVSITKPQTLTFYVYDGIEKQSIPCNLFCSPGVNQSPLVNAGKDDIAQINEPYHLQATVLDDSLPAESLSITWSTVDGEAEFSDSGIICPDVIFRKPGTVILRLTAGDGITEGFDDMSLTVNGEEMTITSPSAGDTFVMGTVMNIKWNAPNIRDAYLSASYDDGIEWHLISPECVSPFDPAWGSYGWRIPSDIQPTDQALVSVTAYSGEARIISKRFSIVE
jgi:hypothetical protein